MNLWECGTVTCHAPRDRCSTQLYGRPNILYRHPSLFGSRDYLQEAACRYVHICWKKVHRGLRFEDRRRI